jgi:hypothetical protein
MEGRSETAFGGVVIEVGCGGGGGARVAARSSMSDSASMESDSGMTWLLRSAM